MTDLAGKNTDRELWREREGDHYADSIFVTEQGGIGINCGGYVFVKRLRDWHRLVIESCDHRWSDPSRKAERPCHCTLCGTPKVVHESDLTHSPIGLADEEVATVSNALHRFMPDWTDERGAEAARAVLRAQRKASDVLPRLNIKCETHEDGITGTTSLDVIRVEREDDGSFTAVTDHWPLAASYTFEISGVKEPLQTCAAGSVPEGTAIAALREIAFGNYSAPDIDSAAAETYAKIVDRMQDVAREALSASPSPPVQTVENVGGGEEEPALWSIIFNGAGGPNATTTFTTRAKAAEYASMCTPPVRVVPLFLHSERQSVGGGCQ